jgi:GT2 family glycosyltransferase
MAPRVSFIVPCFRLAHLLPECIESILAQSFGDLEVLIMDDCSPDNTPEVARGFGDSRVIHVRNESNLGHLRNYNKGISLARGEYIWLISADDRLSREYALRRFVDVLDRAHNVGYVVCKADLLHNEADTAAKSNSKFRAATFPIEKDTVMFGHEFLRKLITCNCVDTPGVMVRSRCYREIGLFPVDLPYAADWYMWCRLALDYDVAYLADAMVNYRIHQTNMSHYFWEHSDALSRDVIEIRWRIRGTAEAAGYRNVARMCDRAITLDYAERIARGLDENWSFGMSFEEVERSLRQYCSTEAQVDEFRSAICASVGDHWREAGDWAGAQRQYEEVLRRKPINPRVWAKYAFARMGIRGQFVREGMGRLARAHRGMTMSSGLRHRGGQERRVRAIGGG